MAQYALLAGIGRYEDSQISDLKFADSDVLAFRDRLANLLGFAEENIYVYTRFDRQTSAMPTLIERSSSSNSRKRLQDPRLILFYNFIKPIEIFFSKIHGLLLANGNEPP